jgi:heme-degrading monooxygenase HmoA
MRLPAAMLPVIAALGLVGCTIAQPFRAPGLAEAGPGPYLVVLTQASLTDAPDAAQDFFAISDALERDMRTRAGYIGHARRKQIFGDTAWTMTVWRDVDSMLAFVNGPAHGQAMRRTGDLVKDARFARTWIAADALPLSWEDAELLLAQAGRAYWE